MDNKEYSDNGILSLIESSIKQGNADIEKFHENLLSNLNKIDKIKNIKAIIEKKLSEKNIYFIRHAESEHNVLEAKYAYYGFEKWNIQDPKLTKKGIEQTKSASAKLKNFNIHFDTVFVSPLTRAIQTYFLIEKDLNNDAKIIVTDFIKEVVNSQLDKNKGKKLSLLKEEYKNTKLDFQYMTKEIWWYNLGNEIDKESEGQTNFGLRLGIFILWMAFRPEKNILLISHSHVFVNMQESFGIRNADVVKMNNNDLVKKVNWMINYDSD